MNGRRWRCNIGVAGAGGCVSGEIKLVEIEAGNKASRSRAGVVGCVVEIEAGDGWLRRAGEGKCRLTPGRGARAPPGPVGLG